MRPEALLWIVLAPLLAVNIPLWWWYAGHPSMAIVWALVLVFSPKLMSS